MFQVYNHNSIYRALIAVMDAFSDMKVDRFNEDGSLRTSHICPISLGHQSVSVARARLTERTSPNIRTVLPRMGLRVTGLERETEALEDPKNSHVVGNNTLRAGVPYRLSMRLTVYFKYMEIGMQIVEGITSQFTPNVFIHMFQAPSIMRATQVPLDLDRRIDLNFGPNMWAEGPDRGDDSIMEVGFDLSMVINMWPPTVTDGDIIHDVCLNLIDLQDNLLAVQERWRAVPNTVSRDTLTDYSSAGALMVSQNGTNTTVGGSGVYLADNSPREGFYLEWEGTGVVGISSKATPVKLGTRQDDIVSAQLGQNSTEIHGQTTITHTPTEASRPIKGGILAVPHYNTYKVYFFVEHEPVENRALGGQIFISQAHTVPIDSRLTVDVEDGGITLKSVNDMPWMEVFTDIHKHCPEVLIGYKHTEDIKPFDPENHTKILTTTLADGITYATTDADAQSTTLGISFVPDWIPSSPGAILTAQGEYIFYMGITNNTLTGLSRGAMGTTPKGITKGSMVDFIKPSIIRSQEIKVVKGKEV